MTEAGQYKIQSFAFVISVCVCVSLSIGFAVSSLTMSWQSFEVDLDDKINPNYAPLGSLVRLPGIGIGRATAIIEYREDFSRRNDNTLAFSDGKDLQRVKGIGPKTVQNVSEWLKFE